MLTLHNPGASLPGEHGLSREENCTENRISNPASTFTIDLKSQLEKKNNKIKIKPELEKEIPPNYKNAKKNLLVDHNQLEGGTGAWDSKSQS